MKKLQKLAMCNYFAMRNNAGEVIGHSDKVTKEYFDLLKEDFDIELIATTALANENIATGFLSIKALPYEINIEEKFTLKKRIVDKIHSLKNISICMKSDADILFFYQLDFFLFFYLCFYRRRKNKKIYALVFHQDFTAGRLEPALKKIYHCGLKKLDGVFYTRPGMVVNHNNSEWIPDYYYNKDKYSLYKNIEKKNQVVCLGCMNRYKQLEELVEVFKKLDMPLYIVGAFDIPERAAELKYSANGFDNIVIDNRVLSEDEYYNILAESKYSILPYDMNQYHERTSGVLLESIFLGSIPIAPKELLEGNRCPGIGYDDIKNFNTSSFEYSEDEYISERDKIIEKYSAGFVKRQFIDMFMNQ